jgi:hypothetical protein
MARRAPVKNGGKGVGIVKCALTVAFVLIKLMSKLSHFVTNANSTQIGNGDKVEKCVSTRANIPN